MKMYALKRRRAAAGIVAVAALLTIVGCTSRPAPVQERDRRPVAVTTAVVEPAVLENLVRFSGRILSEETVMVFSKMSGRVTQVAVSPGDSVVRGQLLYAFESVDIMQQVNAASAALRTAEAGQASALSQSGGQIELAEVQLKVAQDAYNAAAALFSAGGISQIDHDNARANLDRAQLQFELAVAAETNALSLSDAQINQARTALSAAQLALSYTSVTSPVSGTVSLVNVRQHEMAGTATPGVVLSGGDGSTCEFGVTQTYLASFSVGDRVLIDNDIEAVVTELPELPNAATGLYVIKATAQDCNHATGASVTVSIAAERREDVIALPLDCVRRDAAGDYVYLVGADTLCEKVYVTVGLQSGGTVEITSGLSGGELLVTSWSPLLAAGVPLLLIEEGG